MSERFALTSAELYRRTDPAVLGFDTTAGVAPLTGALGKADGIGAG